MKKVSHIVLAGVAGALTCLLTAQGAEAGPCSSFAVRAAIVGCGLGMPGVSKLENEAARAHGPGSASCSAAVDVGLRFGSDVRDELEKEVVARTSKFPDRDAISARCRMVVPPLAVTAYRRDIASAASC